MGHVGNNLHILAELPTSDFIQQQRENDEKRKKKYVLHKADNQRVSQNLHKCG